MIITRQATESDHSYVIDSFWHGFKDANWAIGCSPDFLTGTMRRLLNDPRWQCTVLCESDVPDEILGYVVWHDPQVIAWLCVKRAVQGNGFAVRLLEDIGNDHQAMTFAAFYVPSISMRSWGRVRYAPYLPFQ